MLLLQYQPAYQIVTMVDVVIVTDSTTDMRIQNTVTPDNDFARLQVRYEESLLILSLKSLGLTALRAAWDGPFQWETAGCAIIRSTWDYCKDLEGFKKWLKETDQKTRLINNLDLCYWNIDKHYLFDLEKSNIPIVTSVTLSYSDMDNLENLFDQLQTQTIVVKPFISASGMNTFKIKLDEVGNYRNIIKNLLLKEDLLVQPFMESIISDGEMSFTVIDGKLTHGVLKKAKAGEFRVQDDHGGYVFPYIVSDSERQFAEKVVANCTEKPLYARVDAIYNSENQILLTELELIEPELFFRFDRRSADRLAQAVQNLLNSSKSD